MWRRRNFHCFETRMHSFSVSNSILSSAAAFRWRAFWHEHISLLSRKIPNHFVLLFLFSSADFSAFKHRHLTFDWRRESRTWIDHVFFLLFSSFASHNISLMLFHFSFIPAVSWSRIANSFFFWSECSHDDVMRVEWDAMSASDLHFLTEICHKRWNEKHPFFSECMTENPSIRKRDKVSIELSSIFNFIWQFSRMRWLSISCVHPRHIHYPSISRTHHTYHSQLFLMNFPNPLPHNTQHEACEKTISFTLFSSRIPVNFYIVSI